MPFVHPFFLIFLGPFVRRTLAKHTTPMFKTCHRWVANEKYSVIENMAWAFHNQQHGVMTATEQSVMLAPALGSLVVGHLAVQRLDSPQTWPETLWPGAMIAWMMNPSLVV